MEYPENSIEKTEKTEKTEKRVERVTTGEVTRRKPNVGKRLSNIFVQGDANSATTFVLHEVLVPAARDIVAEAFAQWFDRLLFGESRTSMRRTNRPNGHVSYNRMSSRMSGPDRADRRDLSNTGRSSHNFDEIVLETRNEADEVLDNLYSLINTYDEATVADLYELVGISGQYTDSKWGWTELRGAGVTRVRNGYLLDLPRPEPLK